MGWNKDGSTVKAEYCGTTFTGMVLESRVKYGGKVQHTLDLFQPISLFSTSDHRTTVLLEDSEIRHVEYESVTACEFD